MRNRSNNRLAARHTQRQRLHSCDENEDDGELEPDKDDVGWSRRPHRQRLTVAYDYYDEDG
jgi:hypothetical protein